jgi:hypothetical protein
MGARSAYVGILRAFVAAAEQKENLISRDCVIDTVAWPDVDPKFPNAVPAKLVIAEVAQLDPVDSAVNSDSCLCVAKLTMPPM